MNSKAILKVKKNSNIWIWEVCKMCNRMDKKHKPCKVCWKLWCYNACPDSVWLWTDMPCVKINVWIGLWHDTRPLIVRWADWTILNPNK